MKHTLCPSNFDYNTNKQIIEDLIKEYPFLKIQLIGRTVLGRSIFALSLGNNKNNAVYVGSVRGSDGLSELILLLFTERLCQSVKFNHTLASVNIRKALSLSGITVIPCLNPDGREIFLHGAGSAGSMSSYVSSLYDKNADLWNGNALGVDISRNFLFSDKVNGEINPDLLYRIRGAYPESEAETKALTRLCRLRKIRQCLELFSGEGEIFYKSREAEPTADQMMAKIIACSCSLPLSADVHPDSPGIMDWFIREFQRPAFSIGIKETDESVFSVYSRLEEALTVFALL